MNPTNLDAINWEVIEFIDIIIKIKNMDSIQATNPKLQDIQRHIHQNIQRA